ncbi:uncharacterized protein [Penaeus vannamei]|uniref:uncharacterized protein n=1 Tax=Penaeus vannamei TaxID=6689 RepID=UPI00387F8C00
MECGNNRGIKLMSHSMKLYERVQESRLRNIVEISEEQFGFMKGKSTTDAIFVLRQLQEKFRKNSTTYECCVTEVKCAVGTTQSFPIQVGLHQGSALSLFLFAIIMDLHTKDCRRQAPWNMMFAHDVVLCARAKLELEEDLELWRYALERRGMKISRSKTE